MFDVCIFWANQEWWKIWRQARALRIGKDNEVFTCRCVLGAPSIVSTLRDVSVRFSWKSQRAIRYITFFPQWLESEVDLRPYFLSGRVFHLITWQRATSNWRAGSDIAHEMAAQCHKGTWHCRFGLTALMSKEEEWILLKWWLTTAGAR